MRVNIVNGSLWVEHLSWRPKEGWYPAKLGPGNMSAKGKIPYIIFALLDTLRAYPGQVGGLKAGSDGMVDMVVHGVCIYTRDHNDNTNNNTTQIPDVEIAVHTADFPCIHKNADGRPPPIIFSSNSGAKFADIAFPDYSYYGHEHSWFWSTWDGCLCFLWGENTMLG